VTLHSGQWTSCEVDFPQALDASTDEALCSGSARLYLVPGLDSGTVS